MPRRRRISPQQVRTGNQPNAYAAIRNLVTGAFRRAGIVSTAHARRYYGRDDQRILALYRYTQTDIKNTGSHNTNMPGPWVFTGVGPQVGPEHRVRGLE